MRGRLSKKLYSSAKWKRHIRRRQEYELIGSQRKIQRLKSVEQDDAARLRLEQARNKRKQSRAEVRLKAPANFSLIENPEETIAFLARIQGASVTRNISLDLQEVGRMTRYTTLPVLSAQ